MNAALCLVVVFIHLLAMPVEHSERGTAQFNVFLGLLRISTFAVQGFVFLGGMKVFLKPRKRRYGLYISSRVRTVFIPYMAAVAVYYLYFVIVMRYFDLNVPEYLGYVFRGDLAAHFYFVIIIMQFYLLYPLWRVIMQSLNAVWACAVSLILTALFMAVMFAAGVMRSDTGGAFADRLFIKYLIYWVGGMYAGRYYKRFMTAAAQNKVNIALLTLVAAIADTGLYILSNYNRVPIWLLDVMHTVYCAAVILLCCAFAASRRRRIGAHMSRIDHGSYFIYLMHVILIFILDNNVGNMGITSVPLLFVVRAAIIYAAVFCLSEIRAALRAVMRL